VHPATTTVTEARHRPRIRNIEIWITILGARLIRLSRVRTRAARLTVSSELGAQSARSQASREKGTVNMPPPRTVQIAALLEQARREAAHVRRAARHHDVANEHVDTLSALIDKANEAATESKESRSKKG
jgi:5-formyltetrahydrofolate cyclo-ligase